jgi:hypothetical protein
MELCGAGVTMGTGQLGLLVETKLIQYKSCSPLTQLQLRPVVSALAQYWWVGAFSVGGETTLGNWAMEQQILLPIQHQSLCRIFLVHSRLTK